MELKVVYEDIEPKLKVKGMIIIFKEKELERDESNRFIK